MRVWPVVVRSGNLLTLGFHRPGPGGRAIGVPHTRTSSCLASTDERFGQAAGGYRACPINGWDASAGKEVLTPGGHEVGTHAFWESARAALPAIVLPLAVAFAQKHRRASHRRCDCKLVEAAAIEA
jgi:hypothetical protein